jgi:hypothetical protein
MKKLLLAGACLIFATDALAFKNPNVRPAPTSPGYMSCGNIYRSESNKNVDDSAYLLELQVEYNANNSLSSFEVLYHMGDGRTIDREKQYNGKMNWDERNSTLIWEGRSYKYRDLVMRGVLRPVGTKKNLWRYDETQYRNGQKVGEYVWVCEPVSDEARGADSESGDLR